MRQRYYDPAIGRFLSVDPVGPLQNPINHFGRYHYAYNNPYKFTDPDGRVPILIPVVIFIAKELAAEGIEQATGVPMPTVRRAGTRVAREIVERGARREAAQNGAEQAARRGPEPPQLARGKRAHREEPVQSGERAEVPTPSGKRMDRYNEEAAHIREIKPDNPRALRAGERQVEGYKKEMDQATGRSHTTEVTPYDPRKYE